MSALLDLREKLVDTHAAVARVETELSANRDDEGLALMLESLIRRRESLETAFLEAAYHEQVEVCSYRLIKDEQVFPIAGLGDALRNFQSWLTTIFDAIKSGPKERARPSAEMVQQTTLDFGYAFAGSLGFVFTIPNDRLLLGDTDLDTAIAAMFKMLRSQEQKELADFAHLYGVSAIRRMYDWASTHARYSVSVDIKWRRRGQIRNEALLQVPEAVNLCQLIDATNEVEGEQVTVFGELVGCDTDTRTFHLKFAESPDIKGHMSLGFSYPEPIILNRKYEATLLKTKTIYYATDLEEATYELLSLKAR